MNDNNKTPRMDEMGTTGLAAYVRAGKNGRARNIRRIHAERVLTRRYPASAALVVERFRNLVASPRPGIDLEKKFGPNFFD